MNKVVIIGGGITGLATAYFLQAGAREKNIALEYQLIERAPVLGGKIVSRRREGFVVEGGPDSFITQKTAALELCRSLGFGDQLLGTNDAARRVFVWSRGKLRAMPEGVMLIIPTRIAPFLKSSLLSWPGKLRMAFDLFIPPRQGDGDESLAHFVRRRLGAEALDRIGEPMIAGIYVADAENLSLKSTFPRFLDLEKNHGSLIRGMLSQRRSSKNKKGPAAISMFMTLRGGMQRLVDALVERLNPDALMFNRRVQGVKKEGKGYTVILNKGEKISADAIVLTTPAYETADLLREINPALAESLQSIPYVSSATVSLGFKRGELTHSLQGFGFVVPSSEKRKIIACSWSSTKFNDCAPGGFALLRAFIGGAHSESLAEMDEETLGQMARDELRQMMGITAKPVLIQVYRWPKANPQYTVGHQEKVRELERLVSRNAGLYLAGSAYRGVGIPDCIQDGRGTASQILTGAPGLPAENQ